ncbi:MAG: hypothetical protein ACOWWO_10960 [Peptococcaceae bacterium]
MFKAHKGIYIGIIFFVMLGMVVTGCRQEKENISSINEGPAQEAVAPDSPQKENLAGTTELQSENSTDSADASSDNEQKEGPSEAQFTFYSSGSDFIKSIIDERGQVEITDEMRERFNLFARDYRLVYMPDMNYYESFFEANEYAGSFGYNNFGFAVFYVLQYMKCPEKMSDEAVENAIESLFIAKESYDKMPHHPYRKLADYEDGYYSPWPEGGLDHARMFYLLTGLDIVQDESQAALMTIRAKNYYFNDIRVYEVGDKENRLAELAEEMGVGDLQAAAKLITSGEMEQITGDSEFETKIYVKLSSPAPYDYNPAFVSFQRHDIVNDELAEK